MLFFNPFALHTIKRVLGKYPLIPLYHHPREIKLFFYYVNEEVENFLNNHVRLERKKNLSIASVISLKSVI